MANTPQNSLATTYQHSEHLSNCIATPWRHHCGNGFCTDEYHSHFLQTCKAPVACVVISCLVWHVTCWYCTQPPLQFCPRGSVVQSRAHVMSILQASYLQQWLTSSQSSTLPTKLIIDEEHSDAFSSLLSIRSGYHTSLWPQDEGAWPHQSLQKLWHRGTAFREESRCGCGQRAASGEQR